MFENHQKCLIFEFCRNFCWIKLDHNLQVFKKSPNWPFLSFSNNSSNLNCLVTLFEHKLQVFKKSPKCVFFAFFNNFCSSFKYLLTLFDSKLQVFKNRQIGHFWHFQIIFVQKIWNVWKHCLTARFRFSKTHQNGPFLAFLINFCLVKRTMPNHRSYRY